MVFFAPTVFVIIAVLAHIALIACSADVHTAASSISSTAAPFSKTRAKVPEFQNQAKQHAAQYKELVKTDMSRMIDAGKQGRGTALHRHPTYPTTGERVKDKVAGAVSLAKGVCKGAACTVADSAHYLKAKARETHLTTGGSTGSTANAFYKQHAKMDKVQSTRRAQEKKLTRA